MELWHRGASLLQVAEELFYFLDHQVGVEVATGNDALVLRLIPSFVESSHLLGSTRVDNIHATDGIALRILCAGIALLEQLHSIIAQRTCTPFLHYHVALSIECSSVDDGVRTPVAQNHQAAVYAAFPRQWYGRKDILSVLERCACIDIGTECHADAAQEVDDGVARIMLRALEHHVLKEMCHAQFCVFLNQRARPLNESELTDMPLGRCLTYIIRHAIRQNALAKSCVNRHNLLRCLPIGGKYSCNNG